MSTFQLLWQDYYQSNSIILHYSLGGITAVKSLSVLPVSHSFQTVVSEQRLCFFLPAKINLSPELAPSLFR